MPALEIRFPSGDSKVIQLTKEVPISIGRHYSNDVQIDDESIAQLHCRVSFHKTSYRVNSAAGSEVFVNGRQVSKASLKIGDEISLGDAKVTLIDGSKPLHDEKAKADISEFELKPLDDDDPEHALRDTVYVPEPEAPKSTKPTKASTSAAAPPKSPKTSRRKPEPPPPPSESVAELSMSDILTSDDDLPATDDEEPVSSTESSSKKAKKKEKQEKKEPTNPLRRSARPGERNILQSPLVLTLAGGGLLILLLAFTFRFMNNRQEIEERFEEAASAKQQGKYSQAIKAFERFLIDYPRDSLANSAQVQLGLTRIQQHVAGSAGSWDAGMDAVQEYRKKSKDLPEFGDELNQRELEGYVARIALGAATTAKNTLKRELLETSEEAGNLYKRIGLDKKAVEEHMSKVARVVHEAKAAILKQDTFDEAVAKINQALEAKNAIAALDERRALLTRYPDFASNRQIVELMDQAQTMEKESVIRQSEAVPAETSERPNDAAGVLSLVRHSRAQSGNQSVDENVIALAENACYAIDTINGTPKWRRVIGFDTPFFPIERPVPDPALLMFDTRHNELQLVSKADGKLIWRNAVPARASGRPVVHEGQIFLPTEAGQLLQYDLETGEMTSQLQFAQPITSSPAISESGEFLFVAGSRGVIYVLSRRPLECVQVFDSGHAPGVIEAPLMTMGPYLLAIENNQADNCLFRLYDVTDAVSNMREVASYQDNSERLGHVTDTPVLRGNRLFVPSSGERVTAFTVTEENGQKPLTYVDSSQNESPIGCPLYLAVGPDDQMWMAARDLRKFQLTLDRLEEEVKQRMRVGLCAQPLQNSGNAIFVAGRFAGSPAIHFRGVDRRDMTGQWLAVLGAPVLATTAVEGDALTCVTATGDVYLVTGEQVASGGFNERPLAQLKVQDDPEAVFHASQMDDGRVAVYTSGAKPHLWVINPNGGIDVDTPLKDSLQAAPTTVDRSLLVPLPGNLQLIGRSSRNVQDFPAPVTGETPEAWKYLASLEDDQALVMTASGRLSRLQLRVQDQVSFFDEVTAVPLEHAVDTGLTIVGDDLIVADNQPAVSVLNARSLEVTAQAPLPQPVPVAPRVVGDRVFVQSGREQLFCFDLKNNLAQLWAVKLPQTVMAGTPLSAGGIVTVALQNGEILRINEQSGEIVETLNVEQAIADGPFLLGEVPVVIAADGSVVALKTNRQEAAQ